MLAVMCLALAVVVGMLASLLVAVPDMARYLRATESELQWTMNTYGVTFTGLLLLGGALGDRYGRKGVLLAGLAVITVASGTVIWIDDVNLVIGLRAPAGVGAALVMPMTLSIITNVFPAEERGRAVDIWSGISFGSALLAGGLLETYSWAFGVPGEHGARRPRPSGGGRPRVCRQMIFGRGSWSGDTLL
ncbi:MFS transporter [Streptomyces werraensis]|uniref:MFS transporter n=1 Tax=Streptomyces werraensis TaxID=68284 RepID=UPI0033B36EE4